jgi:hypothetical protein
MFSSFFSITPPIPISRKPAVNRTYFAGLPAPTPGRTGL